MIRTLRILLIACLFTSFATAQGIKADESSVSAGATVNLKYSGGNPNSSVTVKIHNGDPLNPEETTMTIETDAQGDCSFSWTSPTSGWDAAFFESEGASAASVLIR